MILLRWTVPLALACIPLLWLVRIIVVHHVDVPFWDQWELVPRLERLDAGTLTFRDLWAQHNEHRPLFPIVAMLALARLSGWNIGLEIAVNVLLGLGILLVFCRYVAAAWRSWGGAPRWLVPFVAALVFSPVQWENWVWGWQMSVMMGMFSAVIGVYLLSADGSRWRFAAALACGVWSLYSFAAGLVYWVVGPIAICLGRAELRRGRLIAWTIVGGATLASYFYDYHQPGQPSPLSNFTSLAAIAALARYVVTYLGAPVVAYSQSWAAVAGTLLVIVFAALALRLKDMRHDPAFRFPLLVGTQALGIAMISGLGRAWLGGDQAMTSRYGTIALPMWCAVASLAVLWHRTAADPSRAFRRSIATYAALAAILVSVAVGGKQGARMIASRNETLQFARRGLIVGQSEAQMLRLYPNLAVVKQRRAVLRRLHLSVFRMPDGASYPVPGPL